MKFTEAIKNCFKRYVGFSGRARRSEYWFWVLFTIVVSLAVDIITDSDESTLRTLVTLGLFLPGLSVGVRRLHDVGKSGWYMLMVLIPVVGWILLIVKFCTDSELGSNAYGPCPKTFFAGESEGWNAAPAAEEAPVYEVPAAPAYEAPAAPAAPTEEQGRPADSSDIIMRTVQEERKPSGPKFCTECGAPLSPGEHFCTNCGTPTGV